MRTKTRPPSTLQPPTIGLPRSAACFLLLAATALPGLAATDAAPLLHIKARQVSLAQLLPQLAAAGHINLHYPPLAENLQVSGDCQAAQLAEVLQCLLGAPQNLVVHLSEQGQPQEAWLLGGAFSQNQSSASAGQPSELNIEITEDADPLTVLSQSQDLGQRLAALRSISAGQTVKDPALAKQLISEALRDDNTRVRFNALGSLVKLGGDAATSQLLQMLADNDPSLRLAAVSFGMNNQAFLEQAQTADDAQVRSYAEKMLNKLMAGPSTPE